MSILPHLVTHSSISISCPKWTMDRPACLLAPWFIHVNSHWQLSGRGKWPQCIMGVKRAEKEEAQNFARLLRSPRLFDLQLEVKLRLHRAYDVSDGFCHFRSFLSPTYFHGFVTRLGLIDDIKREEMSWLTAELYSGLGGNSISGSTPSQYCNKLHHLCKIAALISGYFSFFWVQWKEVGMWQPS